MNKVQVRAAVPADAESLALVGGATFLETFSGILDGAAILQHCAVQHAADLYARWLLDEASRLWIAEAEPGGAPVGYAVLRPPELSTVELAPGDLEIKRIYVLSRFQGLGIGATLMDHAYHEARRAGAPRVLLGVYAGNERAIAFYRKQGFEDVGERRFRIGSALYADVVLARSL